MREPDSRLSYEKSVEEMLLIAEGFTQSIVKISGYGKGIDKILAHLNYITRRGSLALEDQEGSKLFTAEDYTSLLYSWSFDFETTVRSRNTVHIVLSTPPGSSYDSTYCAAKDFLTDVFAQSQHQYVFVMHTDTEHPHVHVVVKLMSDIGKKLNPRKAYLQKIRRQFAEKCRQYGILVEASLRWERGLGGKSTRSKLYQMKKRGKRAEVDIRLTELVSQEMANSIESNFPWDKGMLQRNRAIRAYYVKQAELLVEQAEQALDDSLKKELLASAELLTSFSQRLPLEVSRATLLRQKLETKTKD